MPSEIVEGYTESQQSSSGVPVGTQPALMKDEWIANLRRDLRRDMIRELAQRRIRSSSGRENQPAEPTRLGRMFEAFLVGVAVTFVSTWICSRGTTENGSADR